MKVIKRNGSEIEFDPAKIAEAIRKANTEVSDKDQIDEIRIVLITTIVSTKCRDLNRSIHTSEIQKIVKNELIINGLNEIAKHYCGE